MYIQTYSSPIGKMTLCERDQKLFGVWFCGQKYDCAGIEQAFQKDTPTLRQAKQWLDLYFHGIEPDFMPEFYVDGSDFKKNVLQVLQTIPYGSTLTYGDIAKLVAQRMGKKKMSAQAVGGAVGHNRISILIPCHRVLGANGQLTGYAGGMERKLYLLKLESKGQFDADLK